ncbi:hypothetical protein FVR03_00190 [Pontibacter qinzhouensis]|uniref:Tetratricopeptide repeat protein n=1 Tax=Pontibacter qinzhouensis TaxID=2603253 RepID=A0A5C8KFA6_9BACT|nr:hypothetical protein [Pontibacter qinzhouensis]TXK52829.1 hypothetical protein FVR03_00190 [Pontibacter qinzhouensis]
MKKQLLVLATALVAAFTFLTTPGTQAQNGNHEAAIAKNLQAMQAANTLEETQQVANAFERIANTEQKEWLPLYYASMNYILLGTKEKEGSKKDKYLDKGQQHLDKALKLAPKESELFALQGWLHQTRIQVSPMMRGMKYSSLASEALENAKKLNPNNPRAYYLLGANLFYTPKMFGGGADAARPVLEQAKAKFEQQSKPATAIAPGWGLKQTLDLLEQCK